MELRFRNYAKKIGRHNAPESHGFFCNQDRDSDIEFRIISVQEWCERNLTQGGWTITPWHSVLINSDTDAVAFKLRWC